MSFTTLFRLAAVTLACSLSLSAMAETLKIGTEGAYPPFNQLEPDGTVTGFDIDIAQALCAKMKVTCEVVTSDWDGMIPALNSKKFDFIAASMSITPEREQSIDFSAPYYTNKLQFIAPKKTDFKVDAASLKGKALGGQRSTLAGTWLEEHYKDSEIKLYDTQENAYLDLSAGRLDGILADQLVNWKWLQGAEGKDFEFKGDPVYSNDKIGMAVRKGDALKGRLDAALQEILKDGTYKKINDKYFPFDVY